MTATERINGVIEYITGAIDQYEGLIQFDKEELNNIILDLQEANKQIKES
jgi:hypothetical protein